MLCRQLGNKVHTKVMEQLISCSPPSVQILGMSGTPIGKKAFEQGKILFALMGFGVDDEPSMDWGRQAWPR